MSNDGSMGPTKSSSMQTTFTEKSANRPQSWCIAPLVPIKDDGSVDESRPVLLSGQTQVMSQAGPLPLDFALEATTISDAIKEFPGAVKKALEKLAEEMREHERQQLHALWFRTWT